MEQSANEAMFYRPSNGGNGNGGIKNLAVYVSLFLSLIAFGKTIFFTGDSGARLEEQFKYMQQRQDKEDMKKDVMEERLGALEKSQLREEMTLQEQTRILTDIQDSVQQRQKNGRK